MGTLNGYDAWRTATPNDDAPGCNCGARHEADCECNAEPVPAGEDEPTPIAVFGDVSVYTDDGEVFDVAGWRNHPSGATGLTLSLRAGGLGRDEALALGPVFAATLRTWARLPAHGQNGAYAALGRAYRWYEADAKRIGHPVLVAMHGRTAAQYEAQAEVSP